MGSDFIKNVIRNFVMDYGYEEEEILDCEEYGSACDVFITTSRNERLLYNYLFHRIRKLPPDPNNLTKEECLGEFGVRLQQMMGSKGISQVRLSEMTGIPQVTISSYICGRSVPGFYNVDKIAKALNCSVDEFRYI